MTAPNALGALRLVPRQARGERESDVSSDHIGGVDIWLSARIIAELQLPGLPKAKNKVTQFAKRHRWHDRVARCGTALCRSVKGRGGSIIEYHVDLLPPAARAKVLDRYGPVAPAIPAANDRQSGIWSWFEAQTDDCRQKAYDRLTLVTEIERRLATGETVTSAVAGVAAQHGIGKSTLHGWRALIDGVERADWLPSLAPRYVGGGKKAAIDADIWKMMVSQYLLPSSQPFYACYADAKLVADERGIELPHWRTLKRRVEAEIDPLLILKCRAGKEALERVLPSIIRDRSHMHAMQLVNIDGHRWDVKVRWPDGSEGRPMMVAIQDVYSSKMLAWHIDKEESSVSARKAFQKLIANYGVPLACLCDNGRAFASKWITGGAKTRFRNTILPDDPLGLLPALGIEVKWAQPFHGQSKPIERAFGFYCNRIAKCPEFSGAYTGRSNQHKPHDYGARAIPLEEFIAVVDRRIAQLNAEKGRQTQMSDGKQSVDEIFAESYANAPIGKATPEAMALAMMDAKKVVVRSDGVVKIAGNSYEHIELSRLATKTVRPRVIVRYNPDNLKANVRVYALDGSFITEARVWDGRGFDDIAAARDIAKLRADARKAVRKADEAVDRHSAAELAAKQAHLPKVPDFDVVPGAVRPMRHKGQTAAALRPRSGQALKPILDADEAALSAPKSTADTSAIDRLAAKTKLQLVPKF
jgi:putative transposase